MKCANFSRARVRFIKYVHLFPKKLHFMCFSGSTIQYKQNYICINYIFAL